MNTRFKLIPRTLGPRCSAIFKKLVLTCIALFTAIWSSHSQSLVIGEQTFHLASTNSSGEGFLKEYLPQNQTLENWTNMFAERYFKKPQSPRDYIVKMNKDYHEKYPRMAFATGGDNSGNRLWTDFLMYDTGKKVSEWNFFRAETNATGGILVYQFAERRRYKKSINELDSWDFKGLRKRMLPILTTNEFSVR